MRAMVTIGGLMVSLMFIIMIHGAIMSDDIRSIETRDALEHTVEQAIQTVGKGKEVKKLLEDKTDKRYQRMDDGSQLKLGRNPYDDFLIVKTVESGVTYATGICYDKALLQITKKESKYMLKTEKGGSVLQFKVPLNELSDVPLDRIMTAVTFSAGETIANADELLYTCSNVYDQDRQSKSILLEKNLLTDQESTLLDYVYIELLNRIHTDSKITMNLLYVNQENHTFDIQVTEEFIYPNGRIGKVSTRKRIGYQI